MSSPRDARHAVRVFTRHPGIYLAALLTLAIGIGAVTTMFSIVNAVLLTPLPFAEPGQLALVWDRAGDSPRDIWLSPPEFADLRSRASAFSAVAAMTDRRYTLTGRNEPEDVLGERPHPTTPSSALSAAISAPASVTDSTDPTKPIRKKWTRT